MDYMYKYNKGGKRMYNTGRNIGIFCGCIFTWHAIVGNKKY